MGPKIQFDLSHFDRRQLIIMIGGLLICIAAVVGLILLLSGGKGGQTTAHATQGPATATPTPLPSLPPTPTDPPTETPTPTATPTLVPYSYVVQPGDTLYGILLAYGYRELDIVPTVIALNGMANENDVKVNATILIPQHTPTPGPTFTTAPTLLPGETPTLTLTPSPSPEGATAAPTSDYHGCGLEHRCISPDGQFWIHEVTEGDTASGLAYAYDTTVQDIFQDNGLGPNSFIVPGQILQIRIKVTLTPTLTPTGGPDSTATPTPTLSPPSLLAPATGVTIARSESVVLQWAANQPLPTDAYYLVQIRNADTGETFRTTTRSNVYRVPSTLKPGTGQTAHYEWQVVIVNGGSPDSTVISGQGAAWAFTWK